jgi:hypothetical protein
MRRAFASAAAVVALVLFAAACGGSATRLMPKVTVRVETSAVDLPVSTNLFAPCRHLPAVHLAHRGGGILDVSGVEVQRVGLDYWDMAGNGQEIENLHRHSDVWLLPPARGIVDVYVKWLAPAAGYGPRVDRFEFCSV